MAADISKTPTKTKETAGLLMSIIRTLSTSEDQTQREREKNKLERAYKDSDKKLDKFLQEHLKDLTSILGAFSQISSRVTTSQEKIRAIKENLQSCKNLLHCKRDELRKLWIEGIEHKTIVSMLDQIEKVKDVPDQLQKHIENKHYLHATDLLVSSVSLLEGDLGEVEALREVKVELIAKKEELYEMLVDELHKQIYVKSVSGVVKGFQRQGSQRQSGKKDKTSLVKQVLMGATTDDIHDSKLHSLMSVDLNEIAKPKPINEDTNINPEDNTVLFLAILLECLALLRRLPEAIDAIRSRIRPGLLAIVQRASQQVADNAYIEGENLATSSDPQYLLELLELVLQQFKIVAHTHRIVLANLTRIKTGMAVLGDFCLYDTAEVWMKIQYVLQQVLSDYLDIRNSTTQGPGRSNFDEPTLDVNAYFGRKRGKPKKFALFRFDASSHAISMNSYLREQRQEFYGSGEGMLGDGEHGDISKMQFVCKPHSSNITVIFNPLQKFIREIEKATRLAPGSCMVQVFITEFIKNIYLGQVMYNIQSSIDSATGGFDAQRLIIEQREQKELNVPKPLLQSTVSVAHSITELHSLMKDLPDYADQFLNMICKVLQEYRETCHGAYKGIVLSDSEEKRIISATWAKDEDIQRFLRCLPNWKNLKEESVTTTDEESQISEEDMRALNSKESSILTSNLSSDDQLIPQQEIITDMSQMRTLSNICESLEWFSQEIRKLAGSLSTGSKGLFLLPSSDGGSDIPTVSEGTLETLLSLARDFEELGELTLLVLHLEVRVHCFYHLLPIAMQSNYCGAIDDMDPDFHVIKLNKDLSAMEEVMTHNLQPRKFKYVFEGLGHLVASILINSTQYLKRINENGIKKMCRNIFSVQQCLTNITMNRESDLDHARQYYELLYLSPDETLGLMLERGAHFTELEYVNLLYLYMRSHPGTDHAHFSSVLRQLKDYMSQNRV